MKTDLNSSTGWKVVKLGDALTLKRGYDLTKKERRKGNFPVVSSSGISGYHSIYKVKSPGVVMGRYGTIGELFYLEEDYWPHNTTLYVSEFKLITPLYAYYLLQTINYQTYSSKSAIPGINRNELHTKKISIPTLDEQKKIVIAIRKMDEGVGQIMNLIEEKVKVKQWLMQNLLTGKKRLDGFNDNWQELNLGKLFNERNERNTEGLTLLSIGQDGVYPQSESNKKNTSNSDKSKYKKICVGDIGYNTMRMWQGRSALSSLEGIVSPAYTIVVPKENADALFFSYLFKLPKVVHLFWRNSQGLVGDTLNCKFKHFVKVKVNVPDIDEQIAIAKVFKAVDHEIELLKLKTEKLKEQKKGMMQQLLTGKKRLKIKS